MAVQKSPKNKQEKTYPLMKTPLNTTSGCRLTALTLAAGALLAANAPAQAQLSRAFPAFPSTMTNKIQLVWQLSRRQRACQRRLLCAVCPLQ
jgi:hypothetical protein